MTALVQGYADQKKQLTLIQSIFLSKGFNIHISHIGHFDYYLFCGVTR